MGKKRKEPKNRYKLYTDGWYDRPRGVMLKNASDIPSVYRCPSCGHSVQAKIAIVLMSNAPNDFEVEPKVTCNNCGVEYKEVQEGDFGERD